MFNTWAVSSFKVLIRPQASVFFLKMISLLLLDQKCLSQAKLKVAGGKKRFNQKTLRKFLLSQEKNVLRRYAKNRRNLRFGLKLLYHRARHKVTELRAGLLVPMPERWHKQCLCPNSILLNRICSLTAITQITFTLTHITFAPKVKRRTF